MKTLITNYIFNPTNKTVSFVDYNTIDLEKILLITNVTDNIIIYNFANPAQKGVVVNNVLTLAYDTTLMSETDNLQIYYDDDMYPLSAKKFEAGGKMDIGTTPVQVTFSIRPRLITISSDPSNNGVVYVGDENVSVIGDNAFAFLLPGDVLNIEFDTITQPIFICSSDENQYVWKGAFQ